jgi:hypothetical protein
VGKRLAPNVEHQTPNVELRRRTLNAAPRKAKRAAPLNAER